MNHDSIAALRKGLDHLLCRIRAALRDRAARLAVARMSARELADIGLSHAHALPPAGACPGWR
jgi:uncharacterized protein YjiS (DUF1127 family)